MSESAALTFDDIQIGAVYEFKKEISKEDVLAFAKLTGDYNPLHVDESFARNSQFGKNIAHGMLAASLFSTLVGMYCPGRRCLYLSQTAQFRLPIFYGDEILIKGTVTDKNESTQMIILKTEIIKEGKTAINGEAKVKVLGDNNEK